MFDSWCSLTGLVNVRHRVIVILAAISCGTLVARTSDRPARGTPAAAIVAHRRPRTLAPAGVESEVSLMTPVIEAHYCDLTSLVAQSSSLRPFLLAHCNSTKNGFPPDCDKAADDSASETVSAAEKAKP
jgi:hypothetical protein